MTQELIGWSVGVTLALLIILIRVLTIYYRRKHENERQIAEARALAGELRNIINARCPARVTTARCTCYYDRLPWEARGQDHTSLREVT